LGIDEGDVYVVLAAAAGRADLVVTGDKVLLSLDRCRDVALVRTREALRRLAETG
jgi:predicted nucleic acid-binding protein